MELRILYAATMCLSDYLATMPTKMVATCSFMFTNPEKLILDEKWRKMLQTTVYQKNLFRIVTDEAHVIPKW